jgi:PAS domain S-box-containing protein
MHVSHSLDSVVLGRILMLQSTLQAAPDVQRLMEMIVHGLIDIPGIEAIGLCVEGAISQSDGCEVIRCPAVSNGANTSCEPGTDRCAFPVNSGWQKIVLQTPRREYGRLFMKKANEATFAPYAPLINNTANLVALYIENDRNATNLADMNRELDEKVRQQTQQLRQNEERFRAAFDSAQDCVLIWDRDYNYLYANQAAIDHVGTDPEKVIGKNIRDGLGHVPDFMHLWMSRVDNVFETGERLRVQDEQEMLGRLYVTDSILSPIKDAEGQVVSVCVVYRDVTDLVKAQEALRASEKKYRSLFEQAGDYILVQELREEEGLVIVDANQAACQKHGYTHDEFIGKKLAEIDQAMSKEQMQVVLDRIFNGELVLFETVHSRKNGSTFHVEVSANLLDSGTTPPRIISIERDIAERKRVEEERLSFERQVQHTQKLESLGVLAGGIAHDFNNLIMVILGNADLALDELSPHAPACRNIQEIEKTSKRAAELAQQMLAYSGKGRFVIKPIDLNELVEEMAHLLNISISKKAILNYNFADNLPSFDGDATQIRQVIMNLITNASEAIGDKCGNIALSTGAMDCNSAYLNEGYPASFDGPLPKGVYTYLEVADTGCGMDNETIEKIFDPFFTTKFTGRGLGMSAVLGIMRGHKGTIKIDSEPRKGTTFKILFPANDLPEELATERKRNQSNTHDWRGEGTILIADDEAPVCAVGKQMLMRIGFNVLTASDGRKAVETFREHANEIICVLLDLTMPNLNGEQAFREIIRIRPDAKVVLCSGFNMQDVTQKLGDKRLAGFIQKPYTLTTLRDKLQEVLQVET